MQDAITVAINAISEKIDLSNEFLKDDIGRIEKEMKDFQSNVNKWLGKLEVKFEQQKTTIDKLDKFLTEDMSEYNERLERLESHMEKIQMRKEDSSIKEVVEDVEKEKNHKLVSGFKKKFQDKATDIIILGIFGFIIFLISEYINKG